ncbi:MAG TPA: quinone oxidoreductase [Geminicoccaceae bacterium]|nr:quinone oxidoreductase [Geminicoccaceae bacterium]
MEVVDLPMPEPGPGEVLVAIEAAGVNFLDIQMRLQRYPGGSTFPHVAGREAAGRVIGLGAGVEGFAVGDPVAVGSVEGCYAEAVVAPWQRVLRLPEGIDGRTAAAALIQATSAYVFTHETYVVRPGDWVLVHAGAGGTGRMIVQAAKMRGATVVATVSTAEKARIAGEAGADHVVRYDGADFAEACRAIPGFPGFAAIYDSVGPTVPRGLPLLRRRGVLVSVGKSGGPIPPLDLDELNRLGSLYVTRPNALHYTEARADLERIAAAAFRAIADGHLKVLINQIFPLERAAEAQDLLASRRSVGKILLLP